MLYYPPFNPQFGPAQAALRESRYNFEAKEGNTRWAVLCCSPRGVVEEDLPCRSCEKIRLPHDG
jgi:hypothetical protein